MSTTGPNNPGTLASDSSFGTSAWTNPGNAAASDDSRATSGASIGSPTQYLKATNFGFAIPTGDTINGITVEIERSRGSSISIADQRVRLVKAGTVQSTDKGTLTAWGSTDAYATYGGAADLWSGTWSPSDINDTGFGVVISAQKTGGKGVAAPRVDHIRITITHTASASGPAGLKTMNSVAKASIKTINGVAIASVKSVSGVV